MRVEVPVGWATAVLEGWGRESFSDGLAGDVWVASPKTAGEDSRPFFAARFGLPPCGGLAPPPGHFPDHVRPTGELG